MNNIQKRKRAFMSLITRPLGFVRSVSGTLPLTLPYAIEDNADNYTIEGCSVQNGTPSPENPVGIQSVGELVTDENDVNFGKYKLNIINHGVNSSVSTPIYLDKPLRGIVKGSNIYKDKIDFENGTVERKVFEHIYTGDETWTVYNQADHTFSSPYLTSNPDGGYVYGTNNGLCSHFKPMASSTIGTVYGFYAANMNKVLFTHLDCSTIDEWKEYLKAESSKGIPLTYLTWDSKNGYTETESVNLSKLPLFEGTNILSIEGDIQPDMTVIYKASVKEV